MRAWSTPRKERTATGWKVFHARRYGVWVGFNLEIPLSDWWVWIEDAWLVCDCVDLGLDFWRHLVKATQFFTFFFSLCCHDENPLMLPRNHCYPFLSLQDCSPTKSKISFSYSWQLAMWSKWIGLTLSITGYHY